MYEWENVINVKVNYMVLKPKYNLKKEYFYFKVFLYVWVLCLHLCLCTIYIECPQRSEEGIRFPATGFMDGCDPQFWFWESNQVFLKSRLSLYPRKENFVRDTVIYLPTSITSIFSQSLFMPLENWSLHGLTLNLKL